jgi:hypothetical protein
MTISVRMVELTMPPIIGATMRFITSAPVPVVHMIGNNPPMTSATVIITGRTFQNGLAQVLSRRHPSLTRAQLARPPDAE